MDIIRTDFEDIIVINIKGQRVELVAYKTQEHGNIKIGVEAPRSIRVNRAEVQERLIKTTG